MTNEWKPLGYDIFKEGELKIKRIHKIDNVSVDDMEVILVALKDLITCLLYTSPSPRDS